LALWLKDAEKVNRDLVVLVSSLVLRRDANILRHALVRSRPAPGTDVNLRFLEGLILLGPWDSSQVISSGV
jgi:hypothetical protein